MLKLNMISKYSPQYYYNSTIIQPACSFLSKKKKKKMLFKPLNHTGGKKNNFIPLPVKYQILGKYYFKQ